jgi:hypothetical protein
MNCSRCFLKTATPISGPGEDAPRINMTNWLMGLETTGMTELGCMRNGSDA